MVALALDAMVSSSVAPLRVTIVLGLITMLASLGGIIYSILLRLAFDETHWVRGWTSLIIVVLFLGGVQLTCIGVIGEYVGRIYAEVKRRPLYYLSERKLSRHSKSRSQIHNSDDLTRRE